MTGDVVNLRQFRKQKARSEKDKAAEQNRISFGRTKAEKKLTGTLNDKAEKAHEQGRRETSPERTDGPEQACEGAGKNHDFKD